MKKVTAFILLSLLILANFNVAVYAQNKTEVLIRNATVLTAATV